MRKSLFPLAAIITCLFVFQTTDFAVPTAVSTRQQNHAPVVKITAPRDNTHFQPGSQIHYSISVSDQEDGDSRYDEINPKEVLLQVTKLRDRSVATPDYRKDTGLFIMMGSNCFNCHSFDSKVIGPSFSDICKRYKFTSANVTLLEKRIKDGSSGVWGNVTMPTHPELAMKQIEEVVTWILRNAADSSVQYYVGAEGAFQLPDGNKKPSIFLLSASFLDHGVGADSANRLMGRDHITIATGN